MATAPQTQLLTSCRSCLHWRAGGEAQARDPHPGTGRRLAGGLTSCRPPPESAGHIPGCAARPPWARPTVARGGSLRDSAAPPTFFLLNQTRSPACSPLPHPRPVSQDGIAGSKWEELGQGRGCLSLPGVCSTTHHDSPSSLHSTPLPPPARHGCGEECSVQNSEVHRLPPLHQPAV